MDHVKIYTFTFDLNNISFSSLKRIFFNNVSESLNALKKRSFVEEAVIIQKCNSCDLLLITSADFYAFKNDLLKFWEANSKIDENLWQKITVRKDSDAVKHILSSSCGLKSLLLGDNQVTGQIRKAFKLSRELKSSKELCALIIRFCKKAYREVKENTLIFKGNVSLGRSGVEIIENKPQNSKILIFGAGEISEVVTNALYENKFNNVFVADRDINRAEALAFKKKFKVVSLEKAIQGWQDYEIIFFATSKKDLITINSKNLVKNYTLIDLGSPENVKLIGRNKSIDYYDLGKIKDVGEKNLLKRTSEIEKAEKIINSNLILCLKNLKDLLIRKKNSSNMVFIKARLKDSAFRDIMIFRSLVIRAIREFLIKKRFLEINFPSVNIIATDPVKDKNELFSVNWYGQKAFLAQSVQLHKQMMVLSGFSKIFSIASFWREETNETPRHLAEAWALDVEFLVGDYQNILSLIEELLREVFIRLKQDLELPDYLKSKFNLFEIPIRRITYDQAITLLQSAKCNIDYGEDIGYERELLLSELVRQKFGDELFFIINYPRTVKKFYTKACESDKTQTFDLIYRGWEILSGAQREADPEVLKDKIKSAGLSPSKYSFYLSLFEKGSPQHGGFGMGLDRLIARSLDLEQVMDVVPFPRTKDRLIP